MRTALARLTVLASIASVALAAACAVGAQEATPAEPKVQRIVVEDDSARIDELRVRGQTQRIVVTPKRGGARPYEVLPADGGRDLSAGPHTGRGAAGQRVWNVFNF
jgi:hypothetical protein